MKIKKDYKYLFSVFTIQEAQIFVYCLFLTSIPPICCGPTLPAYSNLNSLSNNPLYNGRLADQGSNLFTFRVNNFGINRPSLFSTNEETNPESLKAYGCSLIQCLEEDISTPACACNYNTGNVVTFKNKCDVEKHNCRFDTAFKIILNEICPWEFKSRRVDEDLEIDYSDPKYYNI